MRNKFKTSVGMLMSVAMGIGCIGCHNSQDIENTLSSTSREETTVEETTNLSEESTADETVNKEDLVTLVYGINQMIQYDDATIDAINDYLAKENCSYRIEVVKLTEELGMITTKEYAELVKTYVDEGNALDICYLSAHFDQVAINSYDILRTEGYLEGLTTYLNSEKGQALKSSMPKAKWDSLFIDGDIYGVNGYVYTAQSGVTYMVSTELMKKYNLTEKDLSKPLSELVDLLEKIQKEEEKENLDFACVNYMLNFNTKYVFSKLYPVDSYIAGICLDENEIENPLIYKLNDKEYIDFLKELYEVYWNEKIKVTKKYPVIYENNFLNVHVEGLLYEDSVNQHGCYVRDDEEMRITNEDIMMIHPYDSSIRINDYVAATSIMKASKHKEEAFDFLSRMCSDPELNNLIQHGSTFFIEDGYAYIMDGIGDKCIVSDAIRSWSRGNGFTSAPYAFESLDKTEKLFEVYDTYGYASPYAGFRFDRTGYEKQMNATNKVMARLYELFSGEVTDFDAFIQEVRTEFIEAGGEELYNAVKEQWLNYKK